jgi:hypothetical protein
VQPCATGSGSGVAAAGDEQGIINVVETVCGLLWHQTTGEYPHCASPLVLAALSAGPGSDLQRRLFSLLCSVVKLSSTSVGDLITPVMSGATTPFQAKATLVVAVASSAAALLVGAANMHQLHPQAEAGNDAETYRHAAVIVVLPALFILGCCCMQWAQHLQLEPTLWAERLCQYPQESLLPVVISAAVQQWLQPSSTQEALMAAGYAPQAFNMIPQHLQQAVEALKAVRDCAGSKTALCTLHP